MEKAGLGLVNIDSQAPNKVMAAWLAGQGYDLVQPEYMYGNSRIDFYMEREKQKCLLEVKGCTLERDSIGYFPDAPTQRGVKHIRELTRARQEGCWCGMTFVIQMPKIREVRPDVETHPEFGMACQEALEAGVRICFIGCDVREDELTADKGRVGSKFYKWSYDVHVKLYN